MRSEGLSMRGLKTSTLFFQFKPDDVDRGDVVGVAANENKGVGFVPECVRQQRRRKIDLDSGFF